MQQRQPIWMLLIGIVDRPRATLAEIVERPRWLWLAPTGLALVTMIASLALTAPLLAAQTQRLMAEQLNLLPASQAALVRDQMAMIQTPLFVASTAAITGVIGWLIGWIAQAAFLYFGALIAGGEVDFRRILVAVPWVGLPFVLETILQTAFVLSHGRLIVNQGLSYLVSSGKALEDARNLAYIALGQVSLFRLWHLVLVYLLLRVGARLERSSAFLVTVLYAAVGVALPIGLATLSRVLSGGL